MFWSCFYTQYYQRTWDFKADRDFRNIITCKWFKDSVFKNNIVEKLVKSNKKYLKNIDIVLFFIDWMKNNFIEFNIH